VIIVNQTRCDKYFSGRLLSTNATQFETPKKVTEPLWRLHIGNFRRPVFKNVFITFNMDGILGTEKGTNQFSDVRKNPGIKFSEEKDTFLP